MYLLFSLAVSVGRKDTHHHSATLVWLTRPTPTLPVFSILFLIGIVSHWLARGIESPGTYETVSSLMIYLTDRDQRFAFVFRFSFLPIGVVVNTFHSLLSLLTNLYWSRHTRRCTVRSARCYVFRSSKNRSFERPVASWVSPSVWRSSLGTLYIVLSRVQQDHV